MTNMLDYKIDALASAENWQMWKVHLLDILMNAELWNYVSGDLKCLTALDDKADKDAKKAREEEIKGWTVKDQKALTAIWLWVADKVLIYIKAAKTSHDAWKKLKTMYEAQGVLAIVQACCKMFCAVCMEDQDIEEFI
ncbi:hypothetical protein IEO21_05804 [Rhodonia placenta]|uniref:Retrotransposon Copia-like N-terminal domain-containing protein n=1 Tax=Rhodonia placenta TaxID=104341 RepID=A0A8H7P149_9APHY|nr:hypothetical protein IEO21_05804 [Postia placenta]